MRFKRLALETTCDLRQDSHNMIETCNESIWDIEEIKNKLQNFIYSKDFTKLKNILEKTFYEQIDISSFNLFLNLIKKDGLNLFIHNFIKAKGIFGFEKLTDMALRNKSL